MKVSKPISINIPRKFVDELEVYLLNMNLQHLKREYFYFLFDWILTMHQMNKKSLENQEFVYINKKKLPSATVKNIGVYIKTLINGEFIFSNNHYIIGKKEIYYRLNPKYFDVDLFKFEIEKDSNLFKKVTHYLELKKTHLSRNEEPYLKEMRLYFKNLEMNYSEAYKYCENELNPLKKVAYLSSVTQLQDKRFRYFKRNKTNNRLDTNFTNLKSDLRKYVIGDFICIDLKNSQPFFLNQLLTQIIKEESNYSKDTLCPILHETNIFKTFGIKRIKNILKIRQNQNKSFLANLSEFETAVNTGKIYEAFQLKFGSALERKEIKEILFKVLFSKNKPEEKLKSFIPYQKEKKKFEDIFPFIYHAICFLKDRENKLLPVFLQKIESYIFIDCIARKLVEVGIVPLTIHDSIIVEKTQLKYTMEIIEQVFKSNFDVIPKFEIKPL